MVLALTRLANKIFPNLRERIGVELEAAQREVMVCDAEIRERQFNRHMAQAKIDAITEWMRLEQYDLNQKLNQLEKMP